MFPRGGEMRERNHIPDKSTTEILAHGEDRFRMELDSASVRSTCSIAMITPSSLWAGTLSTAGSHSTFPYSQTKHRCQP